MLAYSLMYIYTYTQEKEEGELKSEENKNTLKAAVYLCILSNHIEFLYKSTYGKNS